MNLTTKDLEDLNEVLRFELSDLNNANNANILFTEGAVVIPTFLTNQPDLIKKLQQDFDKTLHDFPEYKVIPPERKDNIRLKNRWVMGGFGALGNPASFHNLFVRKLRQWAMHIVVPIFRELIKKVDTLNLPETKLTKFEKDATGYNSNHNYRLEQLVDRMMFRPQGAKPSSESWHRDIAKGTLSDDLTFGGWWNFDLKPQYLSYVPKTHKPEVKEGQVRGFVPLTKTEKKEMNTKKQLLEIPPGSLMIFFENSVHEVRAKSMRYDSRRLFLGWRLTKGMEPLIPFESRYENQAVIPLKSGQIPPMYAKLHWTNWSDRLQEWSKIFKRQTKEKREFKSGKKKGQKLTVVQRHMKSLQEYNFPKYPNYREVELELLKPNRKWKKVLLPGKNKLRQSIEM